MLCCQSSVIRLHSCSSGGHRRSSFKGMGRSRSMWVAGVHRFSGPVSGGEKLGNTVIGLFGMAGKKLEN
jgi:hypothetical protein